MSESIRAARKALDWTITDLAEQAGVGRETIVRLERGEEVGRRIITDVEAALVETGRIKFGRNGAVTISAYFKGGQK